jgi:hypothetical protein
MRTLVESLSLASGAVLVACVSSLTIWLLCAQLPNKNVRAVCAATVPFVLAYCLYWLPVWLGADSSEYSVWEFVIAAWFFAGFFPSALIVVALNRRKSQRS